MRDAKYMRMEWLAAVSLGAIFCLGGCKRESVSTYQIPKEDYRVQAPSMAGASAARGQVPALPDVKWTVPEGWVERPGSMGRVGFRVEGGEGKYADIRIIPLKAGENIEKQSVNIWRDELGLPELPEDQIHGEEFDLPGAHTHLYDMTSQELKFNGKSKARTTGAAIEKDGTLWFVKLVGDESVVASQQEKFREFVKSLRFEAPAVASASGGSKHGGNWKTPATWTKQPAGSMVMAAYNATKDGKSADITVSSFPGDVGGVFANVNRWRGQVGAPPIKEADLAKETKTIELAGGTKATVVDVIGKQRLFGLMVPRGEKSWFYKMVGDPDVVASETDNLIEFAATAH